MRRDILFLIAAPFEDNGKQWFCRDSAMLEGAFAANPQWKKRVELRRVRFRRPRREVIALLGVDNQTLPALVLADATAAPEHARRYEEHAFLTDAKAITKYLAATYGGAGPHP